MANDYYNLLIAQGPLPALQRLQQELTVPGNTEPLAVHVPPPGGSSTDDLCDLWGTRGTLCRRQPKLLAEQLEWYFDTANAPAWVWLQHLGRQRPELTLRLFIGCMLEGTGGLVVVHRGEVVHNERITRGFAPYFARYGRPGFFTPYWEDEDGYELSLQEIVTGEPLTLEDVEAYRDARHEWEEHHLSLDTELGDDIEEQRRRWRPFDEHLGPTLAEVEDTPSIIGR